MTIDRDLALAFLRADPVRYLLLLKYLHLYPDGVACRYVERAGAAGVLLSYPPERVNWDRQTYPGAALICLPVATAMAGAEPAARALAGEAGALAGGRPFVCKTCDPLTRAVFARQFQMRPMRAFVSYTMQPPAEIPPDPGVVVAAALDPRCADLYQRTPYSPDELAHYLADGRLTFTIFEAGEPACMCLIFRNYEDISFWITWWQRGKSRIRPNSKGERLNHKDAKTLRFLGEGWAICGVPGKTRRQLCQEGRTAQHRQPAAVAYFGPQHCISAAWRIGLCHPKTVYQRHAVPLIDCFWKKFPSLLLLRKARTRP